MVGDRKNRRIYTTGSGRVLFVGAVHEALPALRALLDSGVTVPAVVTLDEATAARTAGFVDLQPLAAAHGVAVHRTADLNAAEEIARVKAWRPDLLVVVGWTRLLGEALLAIPPRGCVGFHASMLPRHRGRAPVNWAILRGESQSGNSMMLLAQGADTGDIVDQRPVPIGPDDTCADVYRAVAQAGAAMLRDHLPALLAGTAPRRRQEHEASDFLPKRTPSMGITDWARTPRQVHDWIRALTHPYPGAFSFLKGRRVALWGSTLPTGEEPAWQPDPGALMGLEGQGVRVRTAGGSVILTRVQQQHEAEEPAADWFVRKGLRRGAVFDPVPREVLLWARGEGPRPEVIPWLADRQGGEG